MTWRGLASIVHELRARAARLPSLPSDPRQAAAELAIRHVGLDGVQEQPAWLNVCALALAMRDRLVVHELRAPVPRVVDETDLHTLPDEPPGLLRGAWILEVRTPGAESLCAGTLPGLVTCSLGGYDLDGVRYLVGLDHPDGIVVARWRPTWGGGDLAAGVVTEQASPMLTMEVETHHAWAVGAARFALVLGLMLDAAGAPVRTVDEGPRQARTARGEPQPARPWAVRRIYLDDRLARLRAASGPAEGGPVEGREGVEVQVRGHLKRQPHGPGGALRRWIYVSGYEARRWVAPRPVRVVVSSRRTT